MEAFIGREIETGILNEVLKSKMPELIAVFGRRRVGKTFLIRQQLRKQLVFELTGTSDTSMRTQLENFHKALGLAAGNPKLYQKPANWPDAFDLLSHLLLPKLADGKCVVFLDEFPWLNTHRSGFLAAFDHWWNSWANKQASLIVVICGSAASWMIKNIVNNRGGLHNRITRKIRLLPFTLRETEKYVQSLNIAPDRYQILQLYMVMGGIPHYLKEIRKGESATQMIDRICFTKDGLLEGEFKNLYHALFDDADRHLAIVKALARNNAGMTRTQILDAVGVNSGGTITSQLDELIESGFVTAWLPYNKKSKDQIFKLADEFTHFYLKFMESNRSKGKGTWQAFATGQSWRSWSGVAFERICLKHIVQIKQALGISGVYTEEAAWRKLSQKEQGAQIDLLIDRKDQVINICEMKYAESEFMIDKKYSAELENKRTVFKQATGTRKSLFLVMLTTFGLKQNEYSERLIQNSLTMDDLFE